MSQQPAAEYIGSYKLGKALGSGSFCQVRLGTHVPTGRKVAIKVMSRRRLKKQNMLEKVRSEIHILRMFTHPHIIRILEVIDTPNDICIVMEHVNGGELFDYIVSRGRLSEVEARTFTQQLVSALAYCHAHAVVHRDLKPENLLLAIREEDSGSSTGTPLLKLADFGLSTVMRDGVFLKTSCGSPNYAAPEVISAAPYTGPEIDVWSCGVILYACLCGTLPFDHENIRVLFKKIKSGQFEIPGFVSLPARDLLQRMLVVDPLRRITIPEITKHPWFRVDLPIYLWLSAYEFEKEAQNVDMGAVTKMCEQYGYSPNAVLNAIRMGPELTTSRKNGNKHNLRQLAIIYKLTSEDNSLNRYSEIALKKMERIAHILGVPTDDPEVLSQAMTGEEEDKGVIQELEAMRVRFKTPLLTVPGRWYAGHWVTSEPYVTITALLVALQTQGYQWRMLGPYSIRCILYTSKKNSAGITVTSSLASAMNADATQYDAKGYEGRRSELSSEFGKSEKFLKNEFSQSRDDVHLSHSFSNTDNNPSLSPDNDNSTLSKEVLLKLSIIIYSTHRGHCIIDIRRAGGHHVVFLQSIHHLLHEFRTTLFHMTQQQQHDVAVAQQQQQQQQQQYASSSLSQTASGQTYPPPATVNPAQPAPVPVPGSGSVPVPASTSTSVTDSGAVPVSAPAGDTTYTQQVQYQQQQQQQQQQYHQYQQQVQQQQQQQQYQQAQAQAQAQMQAQQQFHTQAQQQAQQQLQAQQHAQAQAQAQAQMQQQLQQMQLQPSPQLQLQQQQQQAQAYAQQQQQQAYAQQQQQAYAQQQRAQALAQQQLQQQQQVQAQGHVPSPGSQAQAYSSMGGVGGGVGVMLSPTSSTGTGAISTAATGTGTGTGTGVGTGIPASLADIPLLDVPTLTLAGSLGLSEAHLRFISQYLSHLQIPAVYLSVSQVVKRLADMDVGTRNHLFSDASHLGEYITLLAQQCLQQHQMGVGVGVGGSGSGVGMQPMPPGQQVYVATSTPQVNGVTTSTITPTIGTITPVIGTNVPPVITTVSIASTTPVVFAPATATTTATPTTTAAATTGAGAGVGVGVGGGIGVGTPSQQQQQQQQHPPTTTPTSTTATTTTPTSGSTSTSTSAPTATPSVDPTMLLTDLPPDQLLRYYQQCHSLYVRHYERYCALVQARERGEVIDVGALRSLHDQLQQQANALTHMRHLPNMPTG